MELTDNDRQMIKEWGFTQRDIAQIALVLSYTTYEYARTTCDENYNVTCGKYKPISETKALRILGRKQFLQGICRSAFHRDATCENDNREIVHFNSKRYFKEQ